MYIYIYLWVLSNSPGRAINHSSAVRALPRLILGRSEYGTPLAIQLRHVIAPKTFDRNHHLAHRPLTVRPAIYSYIFQIIIIKAQHAQHTQTQRHAQVSMMIIIIVIISPGLHHYARACVVILSCADVLCSV